MQQPRYVVRCVELTRLAYDYFSFDSCQNTGIVPIKYTDDYKMRIDVDLYIPQGHVRGLDLDRLRAHLEKALKEFDHEV